MVFKTLKHFISFIILSNTITKSESYFLMFHTANKKSLVIKIVDD